VAPAQAARSTPPEAGAPARVNVPDRAFGWTLYVLGGAVLLVAALIVSELWKVGGGALSWRFVRGSAWDPTRDLYGGWPFVYGTLVTSGVALVLALPVSLGIAIFLTEMAPARLRSLV